MRLSPARGRHYLNFNHNFAWARHAYAKCVLRQLQGGREGEAELSRAKEREREADTSIYICILTMRRLKPTRSARTTQLRQPRFCLPFEAGRLRETENGREREERVKQRQRQGPQSMPKIFNARIMQIRAPTSWKNLPHWSLLDCIFSCYASCCCCSCCCCCFLAAINKNYVN